MSSPLAAAILALLTLPNGHGVAQCRPRCAEHAQALAHAIEEAAATHGVDPWLLAALGYHESSLTGRDNATSAGYFGWHRRSSLWRSCSAPCGMDEQADLAALEMRRLTLVCGDEQHALSAWQSGACSTASGLRYAVRVLRVRERMRGRRERIRQAVDAGDCA